MFVICLLYVCYMFVVPFETDPICPGRWGRWSLFLVVYMSDMSPRHGPSLQLGSSSASPASGFIGKMPGFDAF